MRKIFTFLISCALLFFSSSQSTTTFPSFNTTTVFPINDTTTSLIYYPTSPIYYPTTQTPSVDQTNFIDKSCEPLNSQTNIDCNVIHDFAPFFGSYAYFLLIIGSSFAISKVSSSGYFNHYVNIFNIIQLTSGTIIFCGIYFLWWLAMFIYSFYTDDQGEVLFRLGIWISLNMATVLLPITRNSIWIILFKISYDRIVNIHKFIAILCLISVIVKLIAVVIYINFPFLFIVYNADTAGSPLAGTLSSLAMLLSSILAVPVIRKNFFEVFYFSHKFLFIFAIATGIWHYILTFYYIIPTFFLYLIDIFCRHFHTKKALYSHLKVIGDETKNTSCILMTISLLNNVKTPPGSYFFICFKEISVLEWHPLSLITQNHDNLTFCAKDMSANSWVHKIKVMDKNKSLHSKLKDSEVLIQGPYGHININYKLDKYKYLILVSGGIGVTPILSILHDINQNKYKHIKHVYLLWVVNHSSFVTGFNYLLAPLNKRLFTLNIYSTNKNPENEEKNDHFQILNTRPKIGNIITDICIENQIINTELGVSCCGPESLSKDVIITCSKMNIDICNENF